MNEIKLKLRITSAFCVGALVAGAARQNWEAPLPVSYSDRESSRVIPLDGVKDDTRFFELSVNAEPSAYSAVQAAFGTDRNRNEVLEPEETELVVGRDCNQWFVRNERLGTTVVLTDVAETYHTFKADVARAGSADAPAKADGMFFSRDWDLVKFTTRGETLTNLVTTAKFKIKPFVIVVR